MHVAGPGAISSLSQNHAAPAGWLVSEHFLNVNHPLFVYFWYSNCCCYCSFSYHITVSSKLLLTLDFLSLLWEGVKRG